MISSTWRVPRQMGGNLCIIQVAVTSAITGIVDQPSNADLADDMQREEIGACAAIYTASAEQLFMRVKVDPISFNPVGEVIGSERFDDVMCLLEA